MSKADKVKSVLDACGINQTDLTKCLNISHEAVRIKFSRDSFSVDDLIKICDYVGCKLQIRKYGTNVTSNLEDVNFLVDFDKDDISLVKDSSTNKLGKGVKPKRIKSK